MINAPQKDFSDDETSAILTYLQNGGHAFLVSGYTTTEMPNYHSILEQYGVSIEKALFWKVTTIIMFPEIPLYLVPEDPVLRCYRKPFRLKQLCADADRSEYQNTGQQIR